MSVQDMELSQRWGAVQAAFRGGKKAEDDQLRRLRFWEMVVLLPLLALATGGFFTFGTVEVRGVSMEPQFRTGDRLFYIKPYALLSPLKPGDIVVIDKKYGAHAGVHLIKRVFFIQNDRGDAEWAPSINTSRGQVSPKAFFPFYAASYASRKAVGRNHILVVGDNFDNSEDSRDDEIGEVSPDEIMGKVILR
jgi:signal peptidase I